MRVVSVCGECVWCIRAFRCACMHAWVYARAHQNNCGLLENVISCKQ